MTMVTTIRTVVAVNRVTAAAVSSTIGSRVEESEVVVAAFRSMRARCTGRG